MYKPNRSAILMAAVSVGCVVTPSIADAQSMVFTGTDGLFKSTSAFVSWNWFNEPAPRPRGGQAEGQLDVAIPTSIAYTPLWQIATANQRASWVYDNIFGVTMGGVAGTLNGIEYGDSRTFGGGCSAADVISAGAGLVLTGGFKLHIPVTGGWGVSTDGPCDAKENTVFAGHGVLAATMAYAFTIDSAPLEGSTHLYSGSGTFEMDSASGWALYGPGPGGGTVNVGAPVTIYGLGIDSASPYTFSGPGPITFAADPGAALAPVSVTGSATASHTISTPLIVDTKLSTTVDANQSLALTGSLTVNSGSPLIKGGKGTLSIPNFSSTGALAVGEGTLKISSNGGVTKVKELSLSTNNAQVGSVSLSPAVLNMKTSGSGVIIDWDDHDPSDPEVPWASPLGSMFSESSFGPTGLIKLIKNGFGSGDWQGPTQSGDSLEPFITSEAAQNDSRLKIGYAEASDLFGPSGGTFMSETVDGSAALLRVTFGGDANLDGNVGNPDFNKLAANFGGSDKAWWQGDFNYDGLVNNADFNILAGNFGLSVGPEGPTPDDWATLAAAVPEPSTAYLLSFGAIGLLRRRRRA